MEETLTKGQAEVISGDKVIEENVGTFAGEDLAEVAQSPAQDNAQDCSTESPSEASRQPAQKSKQEQKDRKPIITIKDADILNGESAVLYGLNMDIYPGDFVYIVGKVGTGKTSIIRTMIAENPLGKGNAYVCGHNLSTIKTKEIPYLRRKLGVVFQDFQLLTDRSVEANLEFVLKATGWKDKDSIQKRINEVLSAVGMSTKAHKYPFQLSGGEQQRIAIARSLLNHPEVIIADEPTGNLDNETADGILNLLTSINKDRGTAIIMVTHNRSIFEKYPGRVFICKDESCQERLNDEIIDLALTI